MLYAIDVLESLDKRNLITPLLLYHESPKVRARALTALAGGAARAGERSGGPNVQRMLGDEHAEVRAAAVGALAAIGDESETELVRPVSGRRQPAPRRDRRGGARAQRRARPIDRPRRSRRSRGCRRDPDRPQRVAPRSGDRAAADPAIRALSQLLVPLLLDPNPRVAEEAMRSVRQIGQRDFLFVPALVSLLRNRRLKGAARDVLVGYGEEVVAALEHFLRDPDEDIWVRRHIPATLARIPSQKSMDVLVAALDGETDGFLRFKLVSAIDRLRREHAELTFDTKPLEALLLREGDALLRVPVAALQPVRARRRSPRDGLLDEALDEKIARSRNRVFLLLGLLYPLARHRRGALGARARRRARQGVGVRVPRQRARRPRSAAG